VRGLLRGLQRGATEIGKRGLRAAQAGLQQLEAALEENGGGSGGNHNAPPYPPPPAVFADPNNAPPPPAEEVLSIAIHVSELPSGRRQQEALARLPRALRERVEAVLREQAMAGGGAYGSRGGYGGADGDAGGGGGGGVIHTAEFNLDGEFGDERLAAAVAAGGAAAAAAAAGASRPGAAAGARPAAAAAPPRPAAAKPAPPPKPKAAAAAAAAAKPAAAASGDLLGLGHDTRPQPHNSSLVDVSDAQDFFGGGGSGGGGGGGGTGSGAGAAPRAATPATGLDELLSPPGAGATSSSDAAIAAANAGRGEPPPDPNEPEHRRALRERRLAEREEKMRAALAAKQGADVAEEQRREAQQRHKLAHAPRVEAWRARNKGNLRGLLASLQTVLWEGSGWTPVGISDLLEPAHVRKAWMRANLVVHPDKVRQKHGSDEHVAISDLVFDALKEGMAAFQG
jgi:hypothetical protein